jgi:hypothetical protein
MKKKITYQGQVVTLCISDQLVEQGWSNSTHRRDTQFVRPRPTVALVYKYTAKGGWE